MQLKSNKQEKEEKILEELYEKLENTDYQDAWDVIIWPYQNAMVKTLESWDELTTFLHNAFKNITVDKIKKYIEWYFRRKKILKMVDKNKIDFVLKLIQSNKSIFKSDEDVKILEDFIKWKYDVISVSNLYDENNFLSINFNENFITTILWINKLWLSSLSENYRKPLSKEENKLPKKVKVVVWNKEKLPIWETFQVLAI